MQIQPVDYDYTGFVVAEPEPEDCANGCDNCKCCGMCARCGMVNFKPTQVVSYWRKPSYLPPDWLHTGLFTVPDSLGVCANNGGHVFSANVH